tara:strand:+ start:38925 stop:39173 length:249 start_codon:yes stop_codon:yes gene_type:complete
MKTIKVFGAGWCSGCKQLKDYLDVRGVEYTYYDIDTEEGGEEATKYTVRSLPTTVIEREREVSRILVGVQQGMIEKEVVSGD